jgi:ankyrin repeat protein
LPALALAVRAGDSEMVRLLLKKKAQVNCRLNTARHADLTPLHIACGCLGPNAIDIVQQLLEHGAQVDAESSPGEKEYLSLADPLVIDSNKIVNYFYILSKENKKLSNLE